MSMPRWMYLINPVGGTNKQEIAREIEKPNHGTIGKYLFFSDDKNKLIDLGKNLLVKYDLHIAKVPLSNKPQATPGKGFVLCIYDSTPKLEQEFVQYAADEKIIYEHWKSDADTLSNVL